MSTVIPENHGTSSMGDSQTPVIPCFSSVSECGLVVLRGLRAAWQPLELRRVFRSGLTTEASPRKAPAGHPWDVDAKELAATWIAGSRTVS